MPILLDSLGIFNLLIPNIIFIIIGALGPTISAFILTYKDEGKEGMNKLIRRAFNYKVRWFWYVPTFLLIPAMFLTAYYINFYFGVDAKQLQIFSQPWLIIPYIIYMFLLGGSVQEEFGWRGYILDKLQSRWSALVSSLVLGSIWSIWHLPLFFVSGSGQSYIPFWAYFISIASLTILFTWLYNNTNRNILIALIFHTMFNLSFSSIPLFEMEIGGNHTGFLYMSLIIFITASIIVIIYGPKRLSRTKEDLS